MQTKVIIYCAAPDWAAAYREALLPPDDWHRRRHKDWAVSRALKACAPCDRGVLSHCRQHAVWAVPLSGCLKLGVDLEYMQPRRFEAWHELLVTPDELAWLQRCGGRPAAYYALWTLKEALVKAGGGEWADMGRVGLVRTAAHHWLLHGFGQQDWSGGVWRLGRFMAAAVWQGSEAAVEWQGVGRLAGIRPQSGLRFQAA